MKDRLSHWPDDLVELVRRAGTLCLNVDNPGWEDARGYLFDESTATLYFPIAKKYLPDDPDRYRVLIWSQPRVLITGELRPATSEEDTAIELALAMKRGMPLEKARYMLLDPRSQKARKNRYKLLVAQIEWAPGAK